MSGTLGETEIPQGAAKSEARYFLAATYSDTSERVIEPFWKYEEQTRREEAKRRWGGRAECMASAANVCTTLYPFYGAGHEMCMLGVNTKQGTLPGAVRASAVRFAYDLEEFDGGLAYALGYRMPLCPTR